MEQKAETLRQQKVGAQIQRDLSEIFQREYTGVAHGVVLSVTKVRVSSDLTSARVYLSVFPFAKAEGVLKKVKEAASGVRGALGRRIRHQLRVVPELHFYIDDSMEYVENIERLIEL